MLTDKALKNLEAMLSRRCWLTFSSSSAPLVAHSAIMELIDQGLIDLRAVWDGSDTVWAYFLTDKGEIVGKMLQKNDNL